MSIHILAPPQTDAIVVVSQSDESDGFVEVDVFSENGDHSRSRYSREGKIAPFIFPDGEILGLAANEKISLYSMTRNTLPDDLPKPGKAPSVACAVHGHVLEEAEDGMLRLWETI